MRETIIRSLFVAVIILCLLSKRVSAFFCYPDYCQNLTVLEPIPGFSCLLTQVQTNEDCKKLQFDDVRYKPSKEGDGAIFTLRAYIMKFDSQQRATAFNLSISDINFHRLVMRYQSIVDESKVACRHIMLYGNSSYSAPKDLYVSCPFSDAAYEGSPYRLEYLAGDENYAYYNKKYIFYVPQHTHIEDGIQIETFTPFIYADVSDSSNVAIHVQQLPEKYNVTEYKVWVINNNTDAIISAIILTDKNREHVQFNFSASNGAYYVKVAAMHPDCGEYGCANSTTPYIYIKRASHRLLIMIISLIWVPPVLLYALYHVYKFYRKKVLKRMAMTPNCLLIYSPTHATHVSVMAELAKYLRCCNINAMIDMLDIAETASKDPGLWCNTAFQAADVVLVATSPPPSSKIDTTIIYRNVDNHLLRLLKENYPQRNKRYYAVHLPYCKPDEIPEEARLFRKFHLPEDLAKLVNTIHGIGCQHFLVASNGELVESIRYATVKLLEDEISVTKNIKETDGLLSPIVVQETIIRNDDQPIINKTPRCPDTPDCEVMPQSFTTNIDELNLLGEIGEEKSFVLNSARNDCKFRIDKLNL